MKLIQLKFSGLAFVFFFCLASFAQDTITVKLFVNLKTLERGNINSSCRFEATHSNYDSVIKSNGSLEDFLIVATKNDVVLWEGASATDCCEVIDIKKIKREDGTRIFESKSKKGSKLGATRNKIVAPKIMNITDAGEDYKYQLKFKVNRKWRAYKIDPKIRVGNAMIEKDYWKD